MPQTTQTAPPAASKGQGERDEYNARAGADAAADSAIRAEATARQLRDLAAKGNTSPDIPMLDSERQGGLVGAAAYSKRKRKALDDWRASQAPK